MTTFVVNDANDPGTSSTGATTPGTLSWALAVGGDGNDVVLTALHDAAAV